MSNEQKDINIPQIQNRIKMYFVLLKKSTWNGAFSSMI